MFFAAYRNTEANAKPKIAPVSDVVVRTVEHINHERRAALLAAQKEQANELIRRGREAAARVRRSEAALDSYRIIEISPARAMRGAVYAIIEEVAEKHGVNPKDVLGRSRADAFVAPRHEAMWLARKRHPDMSFTQIARAFGGRDHTSVIHAFQKMERLMGEGPAHDQHD